MARAWIGTSGYSYPHWVGSFYPDHLPQREWFAHYASRLNAVELNVTFYGLPKRDAFEHWAAAAPVDFRFVVKGSRYVSHVKRLADVGDAVDRLLERASPLGTRLGAVLWQLPDRFKARPERLREFLGAAAASPHGRGVLHAFEFRDRSWFTDPVYEALADANAAIVLADWPFQVLAPGMGPRRLERPIIHVPLTADWVYVRRHGPGDPYGSGYTRAMIATDAKWMSRWLEGGRDAYGFFKKEAFVGMPHDAYAFYNNDAWAFGARDAELLARLVTKAIGAPTGRTAGPGAGRADGRSGRKQAAHR